MRFEQKLLTLAVMAGVGVAGAAVAQSMGTEDSAGMNVGMSTSTSMTDQKPAMTDPSASLVNPKAPVAGHNSFTMKQTRDRLMKAGYKNISGLTLGTADGIWHGMATKNGVKENVMLDYQGNITTAQ